MKTEELIAHRTKEYGDAWLFVGMVLRSFADTIYTSRLATQSPFMHNWILILSKLMRALHSPHNRDHWDDISGYAMLVSMHIKEIERGINEE